MMDVLSIPLAKPVPIRSVIIHPILRIRISMLIIARIFIKRNICARNIALSGSPDINSRHLTQNRNFIYIILK